MWTAQGLSELVALVEPIVALAGRIGPREPSSDDLSPFIDTLD